MKTIGAVLLRKFGAEAFNEEFLNTDIAENLAVKDSKAPKERLIPYPRLRIDYKAQIIEEKVAPASEKSPPNSSLYAINQIA